MYGIKYIYICTRGEKISAFIGTICVVHVKVECFFLSIIIKSILLALATVTAFF